MPTHWCTMESRLSAPLLEGCEVVMSLFFRQEMSCHSYACGIEGFCRREAIVSSSTGPVHTWQALEGKASACAAELAQLLIIGILDKRPSIQCFWMYQRLGVYLAGVPGVHEEGRLLHNIMPHHDDEVGMTDGHMHVVAITDGCRTHVLRLPCTHVESHLAHCSGFRELLAIAA